MVEPLEVLGVEEAVVGDVEESVPDLIREPAPRWKQQDIILFLLDSSSSEEAADLSVRRIRPPPRPTARVQPFSPRSRPPTVCIRVLFARLTRGIVLKGFG